MNVDDLRDPDPPRPGAATLAAVAGRARQLRRRRTAVMAAGGILAVIAVIVPVALFVSGGEPDERLVPATAPTTETTVTEATVTEATVTTTAPSTTPAPSTAPAVAAVPSVVAVRSDGDAVTIDADGAETGLYDGFDPRVQPPEGDPSLVDRALVTPDGRFFVSTCCETAAYQEVVVGTGPVEGSLIYGQSVDLGPDGTSLVSVSPSALEVRTLDGEQVAAAGWELDPSRMPYGVAWIGAGSIATVELRQPDSGNEFRLVVTDAALSGYSEAEGVVVGTDLEAPWPVLAGVGADGSILVFQGTGDPSSATASTLQAYDPATLERRAERDVALPAPATFAWSDGAVLTWIGVDGSLHVGDDVVPGEFRWARPVAG